MMSPARFANIGYEDFIRFAMGDSLSRYERIGSAKAYRNGFERAIVPALPMANRREDVSVTRP
ncbi:hypothetical protein B0G57_110160 [Trinickia symbiotica]|uniref:Uncharacterized protein n=1 Tax=Trinickia symbiotica TaxID=863227 RepID=A0A2N7X7C7_9BURK|nr:hypothetical protein C0Z20_05925 [Trinickia symbiotica]PPK44086.1 hypothetical protein B0G57_110160 [Trinickia symbiotica]